MHVEEADTQLLKDWMIQRLNNISDADSDVLADYCLALVKSDEPEGQVRQSCLENLGDFTKDHTDAFVDDLLSAIKTKSFDPAQKVQASAASTHVGAPPATQNGFAPATNPNAGLNGGASAFQPAGKRKRSFSAHDGPPENGFSGADRPMKQAKRGRGNNMNSRGGRGQAQSGFPAMPQPPPGFPAFDPSNPMAALMAMQAMGFPLPSMPGMPDVDVPGAKVPGGGENPDSRPRKRGQRCRDYDNKGFCARGASCQYEHGSDHMVMPGTNDEYDPNNSMMMTKPDTKSASQHDHRAHQRGGGNVRGRGARGGRGSNFNSRGGRASFSSSAPNHDKSVTSIVIEQIPEDKFTDEEVRGFFGDFGTIESVDMQPYKRLAVVKYTDFESARKAYDSPKVIFDNRFVKVYWYRPDKTPLNGTAPAFARPQQGDPQEQEDTEMLDPEEVAKRQAQAQTAYEERMKKLKEAEEQKEELNRKIQAQAEQRKKLMDQLAAKTGTISSSSPAATATTATASDDTPAPANGDAPAPTAQPIDTPQGSQTDALRARLAALEAEAATLGIQSEQAHAPFRGRGGFRGARGAPRGTAWRGRGAFNGGWRGGAAGMGSVQRLDNRPKSLSVVSTDGSADISANSKGEESLKSFLFTIGETASLSTTPTDPKSRIVTFHHRYLAESLLQSVQAQGDTIPGLGKVTLKWVRNEDLPDAAKEALKGGTSAAQAEPENGAVQAASAAKGGAVGAVKAANGVKDVAMHGDEEGVGQLDDGNGEGGMEYERTDLDADEDRWA